MGHWLTYARLLASKGRGKHKPIADAPKDIHLEWRRGRVDLYRERDLTLMLAA